REGAAPEDRDRLPGLQPLPAHDGAAQRDARSPEGPRSPASPSGGERPRAPEADRPRRQGRRVPGPALGRPAAARRDRPRPRDEPEAHAPRRDHERARPAARRRGPLARAEPDRGDGDDDDHRDARDELRARDRGQGLLPRRRRDPRGGPAGADLHRSAAGADAGVPRTDHRGGPALMWRRLRPPTRAPVAIAGLAAFPLFFAALLCVSLAIERPHRFQWRNARGKLIEIDHQPTTAMEAKIWAIALVVPLVLVVVGLAASFWRRGGVYVVSAAVVVRKRPGPVPPPPEPPPAVATGEAGGVVPRSAVEQAFPPFKP